MSLFNNKTFFWLIFIVICAELQCSENIIASSDKKFEQESYYYDLLNINVYKDKNVFRDLKIPERVGSHTNKHSCNQVKSIPGVLRDELKLSYFYQKYTESYGIPILGSTKVPVNALKRACYVLRFFLAERNDFRNAFYKQNLRVVVLSIAEKINNVPELNSLGNKLSQLRGRSATKNLPIVVVGEENLLCNVNDKLKKEDLLLHYLSYTLQSLNVFDINTQNTLDLIFKNASNNKAWKNTFASTDVLEYLANGIDVYFNSTNKTSKGSVNNINDLKYYDNQLYTFIKDLFFCENVYINKCKSSKESETALSLRFGQSCEIDMLSTASKFLNSSTSTQMPLKTSVTMINTPFKLKDATVISQIFTVKSKLPLLSESSKKISDFENSTTISTNKSSNTPKTTFDSTTQSSTVFHSSSINKNTDSFDCRNINENCDLWSMKGECLRNPQFMNFECKLSCGMCGTQKMTPRTKITTTTKTLNINLKKYEYFCKDEFAYCPVFALRGDCKSNPHHMLDKCKRSCNLCGDLVDEKDRIYPTSSRQPIVLKRTSPLYYINEANSGTRIRLPEVKKEFIVVTTTATSTATTNSITKKQSSTSNCKDSFDYCPDYAKLGECVNNEKTMRFFCPLSCNMIC